MKDTRQIAEEMMRNTADIGARLGPLLRANGVGYGMYDRRNTRISPADAAKAAKARVTRKNKNKAARKARRKNK